MTQLSDGSAGAATEVENEVKAGNVNVNVDLKGNEQWLKELTLPEILTIGVDFDVRVVDPQTGQVLMHKVSNVQYVLRPLWGVHSGLDIHETVEPTL